MSPVLYLFILCILWLLFTHSRIYSALPYHHSSSDSLTLKILHYVISFNYEQSIMCSFRSIFIDMSISMILYKLTNIRVIDIYIFLSQMILIIIISHSLFYSYSYILYPHTIIDLWSCTLFIEHYVDYFENIFVEKEKYLESSLCILLITKYLYSI